MVYGTSNGPEYDIGNYLGPCRMVLYLPHLVPSSIPASPKIFQHKHNFSMQSYRFCALLLKSLSRQKQTGTPAGVQEDCPQCSLAASGVVAKSAFRGSPE